MVKRFWQALRKRWKDEYFDKGGMRWRGRLLDAFLLVTLGLVLFLTSINVVLLFAVPFAPQVFYVVSDIVALFVLSGLWGLNRVGYTRLASYLYLGSLVIAASVLFPIESLDRVLILYAVPILASSFLIRPTCSFIFYILSILGYTVAFIVQNSSVDYNYVSVPTLLVLTLIGWLIASRLEEALSTVMHEVAEREQAEREILWRAEMLAALHETALDLASQRALPELLQAIVARAVHLMGAKGGGIYLYRPASDDLELVLSHNLSADFTGNVLQRGEGLSGKVLETGRSIAVDNYDQWEGRAQRYEGGYFGACVAVPIRWGGRLLGVLNVLDDIPRTFSPEDIAFLERFMPLAGAALEQTRLLEEARSRWREAETLRQAGAAVTEILSQEERLERILEQLGRVVPYDSASVQLLREGYLEIVGGRGFPDLDAVVGICFPMPGDNPNTLVIEKKEPVILPDAQAVHPPFREPPHDHIHSWLGVPLIVHERVIGLLAVDSVELGYFDQEHIRLVIPFADQVAVALENARLYHDLQEQMEQLKSTQAQLIQSAKLAAVGQLAAGVAHELNNPLAIIQGFAELILEEIQPDAPFQKDIERIVVEARRVHNIVRNLLDFARQTKPQRHPCDLNDVLRQTLDLLRYQLRKKDIAIKEVYATEISPISLDAGQMRQVFLNLITNASHAMSQGGILSVRTAWLGDEVTVTIADTGTGIPSEIQDCIFDPFFTTKQSGTGLGLSVSLGIVQEHGGNITVESTPGKGSTFTVWLPAKPAEEQGRVIHRQLI